jgi:hypothetical protein
MQDRRADRSTKPSCDARPDHTLGHERRIGANAPAAGRPQTADPAGGQGGFRLGPQAAPGTAKVAVGVAGWLGANLLGVTQPEWYFDARWSGLPRPRAAQNGDVPNSPLPKNGSLMPPAGKISI